MRLLVTGPREFKNRLALFKALDALNPFSIVHGAARGADTMAGEWAEEHGVYQIKRPYPEYLGKAGGVLRNDYMLEHHRPDLVLACATMHGPDRGTKDCVRRALARCIPVIRLVDFI